MNFNRDSLLLDESKYHLWTDEQIVAHFTPMMRETSLSKKHHEEAKAKADKKQAALDKKAAKLLEKETKAKARAELKAAKDAEKSLLLGMDAATKKQYLRNKKVQGEMDEKKEPTLL